MTSIRNHSIIWCQFLCYPSNRSQGKKANEERKYTHTHKTKRTGRNGDKRRKKKQEKKKSWQHLQFTLFSKKKPNVFLSTENELTKKLFSWWDLLSLKHHTSHFIRNQVANSLWYHRSVVIAESFSEIHVKIITCNAFNMWINYGRWYYESVNSFSRKIGFDSCVCVMSCISYFQHVNGSSNALHSK